MKLVYPVDININQKSKSSGIEPWATPAWISIYRHPSKRSIVSYHLSLTTCCLLSLKKSFMRRSTFPDIPFCSNWQELIDTRISRFKPWLICEGDLSWKSQTSCYIKDVQIFFHISEEVRSAGSLLEIVYHFFMNWNNTYFLPS